eukprot:CAMPEP_0113847026 /NCGR_PEP_ID=MMETSP0372-20130328/1636_1 /TAXON_ID=340204 /ORGANISM="Lankesteria abbotti" /LENGTH=53 /DNA_ID=CAMNT_0000816239 /DNA_START=703 /DNA_END=864 /DNA_ORIENTATION=+ /assembly_acc=CAM_ASM_000359
MRNAQGVELSARPKPKRLMEDNCRPNLPRRDNQVQDGNANENVDGIEVLDLIA